MHIRTATTGDITAMHRIRLAVRENRLADPEKVEHADYEARLLRLGKGWVAENGADIVGFAVADLTTATVWALFVAPQAEGRGVGRALHDEMMAWLFGQGLRSVSLTTTAGTRAEKFYTAAGWRNAGPADDGEVRYELSRHAWADNAPTQ